VRKAKACAKADDARVLKEASDNGLYADRFGETFDAWSQATDAANDKADLDTSLGGRIESVDDFGLDQ